jgi:hypothetical protein
VLQFAWCVQRVDVHHDKAGAQYGCHSHWILRQVGHHQRDAVATHQTLTLQPRGQCARQMVYLLKADFLAHEPVGRLWPIPGEALGHQGDQRAVGRGIDLGGHAGRVLGQPGMGHQGAPDLTSILTSA